MPEVIVRKKLTYVEEIFHEGGPVAAKPLRRVPRFEDETFHVMNAEIGDNGFLRWK